MSEKQSSIHADSLALFAPNIDIFLANLIEPEQSNILTLTLPDLDLEKKSQGNLTLKNGDRFACRTAMGLSLACHTDHKLNLGSGHAIVYVLLDVPIASI